MSTRDALPKFDKPTLVPQATVPYVIWGDEESGIVNDLFQVMSDEMIVVTITMPPGSRFTSSDNYRPYFDTHECLYVLEGQYTCHDPTTGELRTAKKGEMLLMRELQWHYGFNFGDCELRMLEVICPPTNSEALKSTPRPKNIIPFDRDAASDWPLNRGNAHNRLGKAAPGDGLSVLLGDDPPVLLEILASTERIFFGISTLLAGKRSDIVSFPYDCTYHVEAGELFVSSIDPSDYFRSGIGDCVFIPAGCRHRLFNHRDSVCRFSLGGAGSFDRHAIG